MVVPVVNSLVHVSRRLSHANYSGRWFSLLLKQVSVIICIFSKSQDTNMLTSHPAVSIGT
jgi:hypothetical protein